MKILPNISTAGPGDAERVAVLARETFYETWRPVNTEEDMQQYLAEAFNLERLRGELSDPVNTFFIATSGAEDAGYAKVRRDRSPAALQGEPALEIERMYVYSRCQGMQLGSALMSHCLSQAREEKCVWLWLGVNVDNHKAIRFYKNYGFEVFGTKQFRLGNAVDDDYLMKLRLDSAVAFP